jgi:uncharacterized protein (DUF1697 family)
METLIAFLRGINVGGHHKVPMASLREVLNELNCKNVKTLLNSGNIVFDTSEKDIQSFEDKIENLLTKSFGFPIPVILKKKTEILQLVDKNPFKNVIVSKDTRLYVSFLKHYPESTLALPYTSKDNAFRILSLENKTIISILDLSVSKTIKAMDDLEKHFGKQITTRNWNTIEKIVQV